jgi:hypothetical protein
LAVYEFRLFNRMGRMVRAVSTDCEDDAAALALVRPFTGPFPVEVWADERLVERFESWRSP